MKIHFLLWAGPNDDADVGIPNQMATDSSSSVETSSDSSGESSLELSYASSTFGSPGEDSEPDGIHPFLYEPTTSSNDSSEESDSSDDVSPRLLNLNW